jgi:hypothetical protein
MVIGLPHCFCEGCVADDTKICHLFPLNVLPDNDVGKLLRFCLDNLNLSGKETQDLLYDAYRTSQAINLLLAGGMVLTKKDDEELSP